MSVTISRCTAADIADVVRFIDEHWKPAHVLVTNRELLDWMYRNPDGSYSIVVARQSGDVAGIIGYVATRRYDPDLDAANVVWLTTWKVRDDARIAALGLSLLHHVTALEPHVAIGAIGLNPATRRLYDALGYTVGELQHYAVRRAPSIDAATFDAVDAATADVLESLHLESPHGTVPAKTARYFLARYVEHPFYEYRVTVLRHGNNAVGLLASRVAEHGSERALRIVDFLGDPGVLARCGGVVQTIIRQYDTAYADVYNAGIDRRAFECAGFQWIDPDGDEIVPDHFEPFEARNVRLWFAVKSGAQPVLFKGDSDQDRPNRVAVPRR